MRSLLLLVLVLGCADGSRRDDPPVDDTQVDTDGPADTDAGEWRPPEGGRVYLDVGDAVLSARYGPAPVEDAPALILMNSPHDGDVEGDFPQDMLDRINQEGWTWLVFEYRGTRMSTGTATDLGPGHVRDLEAWSRELAEDGYPHQAIVDIYGAVSTPFTNNAPSRTGVPVPCSVTLAEAPLPEGLDFLWKTPEGVRRQFQFRPDGMPARKAEDARDLDPGDWVFQERPGDSYGKSVYWYESLWVDDLIAFHRETFPRCR